jgi:diguanylate cyclase (GGDEF)-like protein
MPSERQLSEVLQEFARTLVTDFPIQGILDHLVECIVDVLPITGAGVALISPGAGPLYVAASDAAALRFEELQTELGEGPCLAAYQTGDSVVVPDLRDELRFPTFAPRALRVGLAAVFTFPLRNGDERLGALDLYRSSPGALDATAMDAAQTLADVAAAYLINAQARADLRASSDRSRETALHDALTGLPNRILLLERLDHAVLRSLRSGKLAAVLFADLDRFKQVNDLYGHGVGDELLVAVTERLSAVLRPGDTLARMSGDEFVILCEDLDDTAQADVIATRIGAAVSAPFVLSCAEVVMSVSVGIAFSGRGAQLSEQLLQDADTAMYQAKRKGGARHQIVDLREQHLADERVSLERDLRGAPERGELRMDYQPIVETGTGRIIGVEALLRWAHPTRGLVAPAVLVPLAERSGLITEIGRWVLEQACTDRHRWKNGHRTDDLTMSVNVSAHQLMSPNYAPTVARVLSDTSTNPELVTLEVTESVFVQDSERALVVLSELKHLGVKLALDDFGTGYSSLNYLHRFPIDIVKIDQTFVADLGHDPASHAIVASVVELAHMLGMKVVAEGVETAEQHDRLASLVCDACQGYYFSRPISADDLDALTQPRSADRAIRLPALVTVAKAS